MYNGLMYKEATPDENGIKIISAKCGDRRYSKEIIYQTLKKGVGRLSLHLQNIKETEFLIRYEPKPYEYLPFEEPYYFFSIENIASLPSPYSQIDMVIFTLHGQLAKVISYVRQRRVGHGSKEVWTHESCILDYELVPSFKRK